MKRKFITFAVILACFLLQSTVFQYLAFATIKPNMLIVATSSFGFMRGKKAGLSVEDINTVEMTVDGMTTAMITGQVDAAAAWSPNTITLQDALGENYVNLGGNADFLDSAIFPSSYITTTKYAQENKDILVRFAQALNKAHDYRLANQEYMAKLLAKELDAPEDTMIRALGEADWETITKDCGNMDAIKTIYETQQQIFINNGRIPEAVPVENYVLFDVMEEAYKAYSAAK